MADAEKQKGVEAESQVPVTVEGQQQVPINIYLNNTNVNSATSTANATATANASAVTEKPGFSWSAIVINFVALVVAILSGGILLPVYWVWCAVQAGKEGKRRGKSNQWIWGLLFGPLGLVKAML